jgi:hypothetical protein
MGIINSNTFDGRVVQVTLKGSSHLREAFKDENSGLVRANGFVYVCQDSIARKASVIQMRSWNNMVVEFVELNTSGANLELEIDQLFLFGEVAK